MSTKLRTYVDLMALHNEVTGSCILLVVKMPNKETYRVIVDCGLFQEKENAIYNKDFPFDAEKLDYVLVTHNHIDHIGRLPLLLKKGYCGEILCTKATKILAPIALEDSCSVLRDISKRNNEEILYSDEDVKETAKRLRSVDFDTTIELNRYIKATFLKNGHLLGAALILLQIKYEDEEGINLLFTGDYNNKNAFFDVPSIPTWIKELSLTIVQESTYGDLDSKDVVPCFQENVRKKLIEGGTVVIPAFSLGRSQEILKVIRKMQDNEEIDKDIPVYLDGRLAIKYTYLYLKEDFGFNEDCIDFLPYNLEFVDKAGRNDVMESEESKIIVTTSGSGSYGPAPQYLQNYLSDPDALIHFTGFLFENSLGRRIRDTPDGEFVKIGGIVLRKYAKVESTSEYSVHARADEMIEFLKDFKNIKAVLVNHGESDVKEKLAERIVNQIDIKSVAILDRNYFFRISPWGIVKSLPTEFM